ncbi:hypothetical protein MKZ38_007543 [Zalerion maritima]|uniref:Rhodopsin domain-containing protein n=1 Tax=Zalerion maritima TaxID=339359 RepID=A0AAD5WP27_9PEZI|nr:hypothetical protein MKZ38_007543 [Zalerion maritima]
MPNLSAESFLIFNVALMVVVTLVVSTRIYIRVIKDGRRAPADALLVLALLCFIAVGGIHIKMARIFANKPANPPGPPPPGPPPPTPKILKDLFTSGALLYTSLMYSTKLAVALFHIQLTEGFPRFQKVAKITMWFILICWPATYILYFTACPLEDRWDKVPNRCPLPSHSIDFWALFASHILTDLILFIIPFPVLIKIQELKLRLIVLGVYAIGIGSITITIVRTVLIFIAKNMMRNMVLSTLEMMTHVIVATIPGISGVFIHKYIAKSSAKRSPTRRTRGSTGQQSESRNTKKFAVNVSIAKLEPDVELDEGISRNGSTEQLHHGGG